MDAFSISLSGLRASTAQFETSPTDIVRASLPVALDTKPATSSSPPPPLSLSGLDFGADLVGMTQALANYRANIAAIDAENRVWKSTVNLIG